MDKGSDIDMTWLESGKSFLQVKATRTMREKLHQMCITAPYAFTE